jgi:hypothetical protein
MDIDTIIGELDNVLHYRGQRGLVEAVARAPQLLQQDRYRPADDARESLAHDITAAIALLPKDVQKAANGILPIDRPNDYIIGRLRELGIGGYSSDAVRWHRTAVLGRVANVLLELYAETQPAEAQPSYRLQSIDIQVSNHALKGSRAFAQIAYRRHIEFSWTLECFVSDLRSLTFSLKTPIGLKFLQFAPGVDNSRCESAERVPVANSADTHRYILFLADALPTDSPVTLTCWIEYGDANQAPSYFDFVPDMPAKRLSLSFETNGVQAEVPCRCEAWNDRATVRGSRVIHKKMLKEYKAKIVRYCADPGLWTEDDRIAARFSVPSPKSDRRYRLTWGEGS